MQTAITATSYRLSAEAWKRLTTALNTSKNVSDGITQPVTFLDGISDFLNHLCDSECAKKSSEFAEQVLKELFIFALTDNQMELRYADADNNQYVVTKSDGAITLTKHSPSTSAWPWSDGLHSLPGMQTVLYQINIQELQHATNEVMQNSDEIASHSLVASLLRNNQRALSQLAFHITTDKSQWYPSHLIRSAKYYCWQKAASHQYQTPSFPLSIKRSWPEASCGLGRSSSRRLEDFREFGDLPNSGKDKCLLAWELCAAQGDPSNYGLHEHELTNCLMYIFKGLKHLDFTLVKGKGIQPCYSSADINTFRKICSFVGQHFEGSKISFGQISVLWEDPQKITNSISLLTQNPYLTSINFEKNYVARIHIKQIAQTIANSDFVSELSFNQCGLDDKSVPDLLSALGKHSKLTVLNLPGNKFTQQGAVSLIMANIEITSLDLEDNYNIDKKSHPELVQALQKNTYLTSLNIGEWKIPEMQVECSRELAHNQRSDFKSHLNFARNTALFSKQGTLPSELLQLIFDIGTTELKNRDKVDVDS